MRKLKLCLDTSVWNFYFADDAPDKRDITKDFFASIEKGDYEIFISDVVFQEINDADEPKRKVLFDLINKNKPTELAISEEMKELTEAYMSRRIIPDNKREDAAHVAIATFSEIDAVITWNYKHLANLRKAELFNAINLEMGCTKRLELVTPMEVSEHESR